MKLKTTKRLAAALCCAAVLTASLSGCSKTEEPLMDRTVTVDVEEAKRGSISLQSTYIGTVSPAESVNVIPLAAGTVTAVNVAVGNTVKEGQVLAKLDDEAAQLQMAAAQATYNSTLAGAQTALNSTWDLQQYQTDRGISTIEESINTLNKQIDDLNKTRNDAESAANQAAGKAGNAAAALQIYTPAAGSPVNVTITETNQALLAACDPTVTGDVGNTVSVTPNNETNLTAVMNIARLSNDNGMTPEVTATWTSLYNAMQKSGMLYADLVDPNGTKAAELAAAAKTLGTTYATVKSQVDPNVKTLETTRDSTKTQLDTAEGTRDLTNGEVHSDTVNQLQKGLAAAQVGIDSANYQLGLYTLTAPISGVVESVGVVKDSLASSSMVAFTISNKDSMIVTFYVTEDVRNELSEGQAVTVERSGAQYGGAITEIGTAVDQTKGLFKIKAAIYNAEGLSTGTTATVTATSHSASSVITIPCDSVYYDNGEAYVFVAKDGVAVKTFVETGIYDDTSIAITGGLREGQRVITTWSPNLVDGAPLKIPGEETPAEDVSENADSAASGTNG